VLVLTALPPKLLEQGQLEMGTAELHLQMMIAMGLTGGINTFQGL
jgi:hypothetical protein